MSQKRARPQPVPFMDRLTALINRWRRPARIGIATLITVLTIGLLMGILSVFIPNSFYENRTASQLLVVVLALIGFLTYGLGWHTLVGFDMQDDQPWQATRRSAQYVLWGVAVLLASISGVIIGLFYGYVA